MRLALLERLLAARQAGRSTVLLTDLATGAQALLDEDPAAAQSLALSVVELEEIGKAIRDDRSKAIDRQSGGQIFVEVWNPPTRLMVIGGVHIAQALIPMAGMLGYRALLIDPRTRFGAAERFPGIEICDDWPDMALAGAVPDKRTAIVTLTHDPKIDDPALIAALRSEAFYIGALGSRRSHAGRVARLAEAGFSNAEIARVRGPVGLPIGAITPAEIAVSILAEMTAVLREKPVPTRPDA